MLSFVNILRIINDIDNVIQILSLKNRLPFPVNLIDIFIFSIIFILILWLCFVILLFFYWNFYR